MSHSDLHEDFDMDRTRTGWHCCAIQWAKAMRKRPAFMLALALASLVTGCSSPAKRERAERMRHFQKLEAQAQTVVVDAADGISEMEAYKVARDYFLRKGNGCGAVGLPQEEEAIWRVPILEGIAGWHTEDVVIKKSDGSFSVLAIAPR